MKSNLAKFLDNFALVAAVWLLAFLVARYYLSELYLVVITATVTAMGVYMLFGLKSKKNKEAEKNEYYASLCASHFLYRDSDYAVDYFYSALRTRYAVTKKRNFLRINDTVIIVSLSEPLSLKQTVAYYTAAKREKAKTLVILTAQADKNVAGAVDRLTGLKLEIFLKDRTYRLLKSLNRVPESEKKPSRRSKWRALTVAALSPKRSKSYLFMFFVLILGAYFSSFSIYFIVMSAICLTAAIMSRLNAGEKFFANKPGGKNDKEEINDGTAANDAALNETVAGL